MQAQCLANTKEMEHQEWLEWRRKGIGGSDAAAIAGLNKWRSPIQVYLEKTGQVKPEEPGEAAYWGTILEDIVAKEFAMKTGIKIQRKNAILQHPEYPFMIANLDRLIIDKKRGNGVLEVKTASAYRKDAWEDDRVPDEYMIQVQHYLAVTGLQYAYIAVLIGGQQYKHIYIPRDEDIINYLIEIEKGFWQCVEKQVPPPFDGTQASTDLLKMMYPNPEPDSVIDLPSDAEELLEQYDRAAEEEKAAKERKEEAANKLKALLGENEVGICGERKVTWKAVTSNRFDSKKLQKERPDIYEQYVKPSSYRRFMVK